MLRLAFDFIITWRETRTRPNAYLYSNTNCLNTSYMCDNFNDVRAVSGPFLFIIDNNIR